MNDDYRQNEYGQQFGYDHYDLPPARKGFSLKEKMSSPVFATVSLLVAGAAFATIIYSTYPDGNSDEPVPIVRAETFAYKHTPEEPGGMNIPNRDTTIFQTMADNAPAESAPVENLLAEEKPIDKLAAFQRQVNEIEAEDSADAESSTTADDEISTNLASVEPSPEESEPIALKKIVPAEPKQETLAAVESAEPAPAVEPVETAAVERPVIEHAPGSNPETLAYVRSVLDRKDGVPPADTVATASPASESESVSVSANNIEPAAGMASGSYYAQLASVTSESGAASEWAKLQKAYGSELSGMDYRVQKADLGEKGIYYRIQAGPVSKDSANTICDSIKAQKPGGCLVTQ